jgi:uncharacterized membrane protein
LDLFVVSLESDIVLVFHPIAVHFAVALTCVALVLDWIAHWRQQAEWRFAGQLCFFVGVLALGVTVGSGWVEHLFPRPASAFDAQIEGLLFYHEYGGYGLLGFFVILAVIRLRLAEPLPVSWLVCATLGVLGVLGQGYIGGEMVYRYGAGVRAVQVLSEQVGEKKKAPADRLTEEQSTEAGTSEK